MDWNDRLSLLSLKDKLTKEIDAYINCQCTFNEEGGKIQKDPLSELLIPQDVLQIVIKWFH